MCMIWFVFSRRGLYVVTFFSTFNLYLAIAYNLVDFTYYNCSRAGHVLYDLGSEKKRHFVFFLTCFSVNYKDFAVK